MNRINWNAEEVAYRRDRVTVVGASFLFLILGSLHTSYGPAIPGLRIRLGLTEDLAGLLPSSHFVGAVIGISLAIVLGRRTSIGSSMTVFGTSLLVGGIGLLMSPVWLLMLCSAGFIGFGSGGLQVEMVAWLGTRFRKKPRRVLNVVHAFLSLGFVLGPVGIALSPSRTPFLIFFLAVFAGTAVLVPLKRVASAERRDALSAGSPRRYKPPLGVVLMAVLFGLYVGLEVGIGAWEPTHLVARGATESRAALLTALFWGGFSMSRILGGFLPEKIHDQTIIIWGLLGAGIALLSAYPTDSLVLAYAAAGVILGPVFPSGLTWVSRRYGLSTSSTGFLLLGSMSGGIAFPPLMGLAIRQNDVEILPLMMATLAFLCSGVIFLAMKMLPSSSRGTGT